MNWYAAHLILYVRLKKGRQRHYPVWENIVLIRAATDEQAMAKAVRRGHEDEGDCDGSFTWDGRPAEWVFAGVRKVVLCVDPDKRPGDGTEVSYTEMVLPSEKAVHQLAAGEPVNVRIDDAYPDELPVPVGELRRRIAE